jgi:hypothetical protein
VVLFKSPGAAAQFHPHDGPGQGVAKVKASTFTVRTSSVRFEFHKTLAFKVIRDLGEGTMMKIMPCLRMPLEAMFRAVLMIFGDNPCSTRIDLIQWKGPIPRGRLTNTSGTRGGAVSRCTRTR